MPAPGSSAGSHPFEFLLERLDLGDGDDGFFKPFRKAGLSLILGDLSGGLTFASGIFTRRQAEAIAMEQLIDQSQRLTNAPDDHIASVAEG